MLSSVLLSPLFGFSANAAAKSNNEKLTSFGVSEDFLACITEDMKEKIVSLVGNSTVLSVSYKADDRPLNMLNSNDIILKSVTLTLKDETTDEINGQCVSIYWEWKNGKPTAKQQDLLKIMWDNAGFIYDGESFYAEDYQIKNGRINVSNSSSALANIRLADELSPAQIDYFSDLKYSGGQNGGAMVFKLIPTEPLADEDTAKNTVAVDYIHYYKSTVFIAVAAAAVIAVCIGAVIYRKRKKKTAD